MARPPELSAPSSVEQFLMGLKKPELIQKPPASLPETACLLQWKSCPGLSCWLYGFRRQPQVWLLPVTYSHWLADWAQKTEHLLQVESYRQALMQQTALVARSPLPAHAAERPNRTSATSGRQTSLQPQSPGLRPRQSSSSGCLVSCLPPLLNQKFQNLREARHQLASPL